MRPRSGSGHGAKPRLSARLRFLLTALAAALAAAAPAFCAPPVLGVNVGTAALEPGDRGELLNKLAEARVASVRMELDWNRVEPRSGEFEWADFDAFVDAARERHLEVVLVLGPCAEWAVDPAWNVPAEERSRSVPQSLSVWRRYVRSAVSHFRGRVSFWQVREQPDAGNFRGARREYLALLGAAAEEARAVDPAARIVFPEAGCLDVAALDTFIKSDGCAHADVLGVYLPAELEGIPLPWSVLVHELLGECGPDRRRPVWVLGGDDAGAAAQSWQVRYLLAWAFGADRCYVPAGALEEGWTSTLDDLEYRGYFSPAAGALALGFDHKGKDLCLAVTWGAAGTQIAGSGPARGDVDPGAAPSGAEGAGEPSAAQLGAEDLISIGPRPQVIAELDCSAALHTGVPTRAEVLATRGGVDLAAVPMVYVDFSLPARQEFGLYNRKMRDLRGGQVLEEERSGRMSARTQITYRKGEEEKDNPWLYFDVDDTWLYFDRGHSRLAITVECEASFRGNRKLGFNILYDSTGGYRFTPWQWVDPGYGWRRYCLQIDDANFTNRNGYDFRINAKGSKQDLYVYAVTVERLPAEEPPGEPENSSAGPAPAPQGATGGALRSGR